MESVVPDNGPSKEKRYVDTKNLQKVRKQKKRQFKAGALPLQLQTVHLDRLPISNNTGGDARVPEDNFKTVMALSLNLNSDSSASFKGVLLQNFTKTVECYLLILKVKQFEVTLSIVSKNLRVWLNILGLGANDVSAEQCKSK
jgi:hypothetical protein